jgi:G protein beta subunit-like protein
LDRTLCTTSSDKTAKLWDVEDEFNMKHSLAVHTAWVWDCAFSGDSKYVVTGTGSCAPHLNPDHVQSRRTTRGASGMPRAAS